MSGPAPRHRRSSSGGGGGSGVQRWFAGLGRNQRIGVAGGAAAIVALVAVVLAAVLSGGTTKNAGHNSTTTTTNRTSSTTTTGGTQPGKVSYNCPLTGVPAPGNKVPRRPALAVKIGNDPASRPQSGIDNADIVYEEMAEGGITRYMAVFQCQNAPLIGPTRSVRCDDWNVLQQYKRAILAYSGGIDQWMQEAASLSWILNANGSEYPTANAYYRSTSSALPASRGAPYNYYTSSSALWGLFPKAKVPPPQLFKFSKILPAGSTRLSSVSIYFSSASPVVWQWSPTAGQWERFYSTQADTDPSGHQFHATDVVIQVVQTSPGPYNESGPDSPDVESHTFGTGSYGSGKAYVLRNGHLETGTWSRPTGYAITKFTFPNGKPMRLRPGNVWYEIVPSSVSITFTK